MVYDTEKENITIVEERLKKIRLEKRLTQLQASKVLKVNRSLISIWENGYANISLKQLIKIASLYHVPIDYILGIINEIDKEDYLYIKKLDLKYVGSKIKEVRKSNNLTQEQFAKMLFTKRSNISYYEIGKLTISTADLKEICETFGVSADYIIGNTLKPIKRYKRKKLTPKDVKGLVES